MLDWITTILGFIFKQKVSKLNLSVKCSDMEWCFFGMISCIDIRIEFQKHFCTWNWANFSGSVEWCCAIDTCWFREKTFLKHFSKALRIVIKYDVMDNWVMVVFDRTHAFPILLAAPVDTISVCMVWWCWRGRLSFDFASRFGLVSHYLFRVLLIRFNFSSIIGGRSRLPCFFSWGVRNLILLIVESAYFCSECTDRWTTNIATFSIEDWFAHFLHRI